MSCPAYISTILSTTTTTEEGHTFTLICEGHTVREVFRGRETFSLNFPTRLTAQGFWLRAAEASDMGSDPLWWS